MIIESLAPFETISTFGTPLNPAWLSRLRCPTTKEVGWQLSPISEEMENGLPREGYLVCEPGGSVYDIHEGILDFAPKWRRSALTLAGWSNHVPPTPQLYERLWRRRALTLMTGEPFPVVREWHRLNDWTNVQAGELVIDLGTSTGLYARGLAGRVNREWEGMSLETPAPQAATIVAVDLAWGMLREAQRYIRQEQRAGIVLMRAAAENLPFQSESVDAIVIGGSLNEMKSIPAALREARRVVRPGGRMFVMSLHRATRRRGRLLQAIARLSGIKFPTVNLFNGMLARAGWTLKQQEVREMVGFSLVVRE